MKIDFPVREIVGNSLLHSVRQHNQLRCVVEHNAHALVAQLIAESVFVAVVHPLGDPEQRLGSRIGVLVQDVGANVPINLCNKLQLVF